MLIINKSSFLKNKNHGNNTYAIFPLLLWLYLCTAPFTNPAQGPISTSIPRVCFTFITGIVIRIKPKTEVSKKGRLPSRASVVFLELTVQMWQQTLCFVLTAERLCRYALTSEPGVTAFCPQAETRTHANWRLAHMRCKCHDGEVGGTQALETAFKRLYKLMK